MKNIFFLLGIFALSACQKEAVDKVEYITRLKSVQVTGWESYQFSYNEEGFLSEVKAGETTHTFKYNGTGQIVQSIGTFDNYNDRFENVYDYDEMGRLISKESVYVDQNGLELEPEIRLLSYEEEGSISTKKPGDYYSSFYKMLNGNVEYVNCFNCGPVPAFSYTDIPSPLPAELIHTWPFFAPSLGFMTHSQIYSKNIPKNFYSFIGLSIPLAVENEIVLNQEGLPEEIRMVLKEDYLDNHPKGTVLGTWLLEYETVIKPL